MVVLSCLLVSVLRAKFKFRPLFQHVSVSLNVPVNRQLNFERNGAAA